MLINTVRKDDNKISTKSLRSYLQCTDKTISTKQLCKPVEYNTVDIMQFSGKVKWPVDGVEYQQKIRDEEW